MSNVEVWGPLLNANDTIIRKKATESAEAGRWMLCLGEMKETASLTWPMNGIRRDEDSDMLWFEFDRSTSLTWAVVFDVLEWEALTFSYRSPVWQLLKTDLSDSEMAIRAVQNCKVEDLLVFAAKDAFWNIGILASQKIGAKLNIDVADDTLFDVCW